MSILFQRRKFLAATALALTACSDSRELSERYTQADIDLLAKQRVSDRENSGKGPLGVQRFKGYRGLAELPWFELDASGVLQCVDDSIPKSIDTHCHLGMTVLAKPRLDLSAKTDRVRHLLDCDSDPAVCELDLDGYVNGNFSEQDLTLLQRNMLAQGLWGSSIARTHTIPNLLHEMDSMRVEHAFVLPIKLGLWFGDDLTEQWRNAVSRSAAPSRLHVGFSVHPRDKQRIKQMRSHAAYGAKVLKLHPTVQRFYPDDESMMEVYAEAERLGLVVFFHGGRAGIEPESSHPFAMPRHYESVIANFPNLQIVMGHSGARDGEAMLDMAFKYPNTWFDTHGQGLTRVIEMIKQTDGERLLFGTDWPFYHLGSSLAKILLATQDSGMHQVRSAILRGNALKLFSAEFA